MKHQGTPDRHTDTVPAEYWELVHARLRYVHRLHPATADHIVARHHRLIELCSKEKVCVVADTLVRLEGAADGNTPTSGNA